MEISISVAERFVPLSRTGTGFAGAAATTTATTRWTLDFATVRLSVRVRGCVCENVADERRSEGASDGMDWLENSEPSFARRLYRSVRHSRQRVC